MLFYKLQVSVVIHTQSALLSVMNCPGIDLLACCPRIKSKSVGFCSRDAVYLLVLTNFHTTCFTKMPLENTPTHTF
jgi:glycosyltransferase A (GT-A) superfamily protein (DUF2064 family)